MKQGLKYTYVLHPAILLLRIYPRAISPTLCKYIYKRLFIAGIIYNSKRLDTTHVQVYIGDCLNKLQYIHPWSTSIKKNEYNSYELTESDFQEKLLSEKSNVV